MKVYEIWDEELHLSIGDLLFYEKEKSVIIELQDYLDEWTAPLLMTSFVKKKIYTIPREISFLWVKERVIPSGRQNIGSILSNHKLCEYDEMKFLEISKGRCSQDSMCIRKRDEIPDYVLQRQERNLLEVSPLKNNSLLCFFKNNVVKKVELERLLDESGVNKVCKNDALFQSVLVGPGGYTATFNQSIDVPAWRLYEVGQKVPLTLEDFQMFIRRNVLDTSQTSELLGCSRQNIAYMVKQERFSPIKEDVQGNLYLKGEVLRSKWS